MSLFSSLPGGRHGCPCSLVTIARYLLFGANTPWKRVRLTLGLGTSETNLEIKCGDVRIIACIEDPEVIRKILAHLDEKVTPTATGLLPESRAPPATGLFA